ncbi:MAG: hypothetical protein WCJ95_06165 [Mariniphaga sp.]
MEAFNIHMEITKQGGSKLTMVLKTFACTGWEAFSKLNGIVRGKTDHIIRVRLIRWEVLNPFQAHFQR